MFNSRRYAELSEARNFFDISAEILINCVTGNTLFQSKMSVNAFKVEIKILKWTKNQQCICFHVTRNERCLPVTPKYVK